MAKMEPQTVATRQHVIASAPNVQFQEKLFFSGKVDIPDAMIPPWDHNPDITGSTECWFAELTGLAGGIEPEYWGQPIMNDALKGNGQMEACCAYCLADPQCMGAQLYGDRCSLRHLPNSSAPFTYTKNMAATTAILPMRSHPVPPVQTLMHSTYV